MIIHIQRLIILPLQLAGNLYETHVCPVFEIYSRMEQMQLLLPENNDTFSLLSFISKTQAQALCARVSAQKHPHTLYNDEPRLLWAVNGHTQIISK